MHRANLLIDVIVAELSDSEASDIEATASTRKDVSSKFIKKEEVRLNAAHLLT